jgi:hypothetical protein
MVNNFFAAIYFQGYAVAEFNPGTSGSVVEYSTTMLLPLA